MKTYVTEILTTQRWEIRTERTPSLISQIFVMAWWESHETITVHSVFNNISPFSFVVGATDTSVYIWVYLSSIFQWAVIKSEFLLQRYKDNPCSRHLIEIYLSS